MLHALCNSPTASRYSRCHAQRFVEPFLSKRTCHNGTQKPNTCPSIRITLLGTHYEGPERRVPIEYGCCAILVSSFFACSSMRRKHENGRNRPNRRRGLNNVTKRGIASGQQTLFPPRPGNLIPNHPISSYCVTFEIQRRIDRQQSPEFAM